MAQTTQVRQIRVVVDTKGSRDLKQIADSLGGVTRSVNKAAGAMSFFQNAFLGFVSLQGVRSLAELSDGMQLLGARIQVLGGEGSNARDTLGSLTEAANRSKVSVEGLAEVYARFASATRNLNIGSAALVAITEELQNTFRLSGASAAEANSAAIQLSQGLASGQLRGQELRSVLEANVVVGDILAKSLGKTRGELYKFAEQGKITSGVVLKALIENMESVNGKAAALGQTMGQTVTVAFNNFKLAIFDINKSLSISGGFAAAVDTLSSKFTLFLTLVAVVGIPILIVALAKLEIALFSLAVSNPFTALLLGVGTAILIIVKNLTELRKFIYTVFAVFLQVVSDVTSKLVEMSSTLQRIFPLAAVVFKLFNFKGISKGAGEAAQFFRDLYKQKVFAEKLAAANAGSERARAAFELADLKKKLEGMDKVVVKQKKIKEILADLNNEYLRGSISASQYADKIISFDMEKALRSFQKGTTDLEAFTLELNRIKQVQANRSFNELSTSITEFQRVTDQNTLEKLNIQLTNGTINLFEYNRELDKLRDNFDFNRSLGNGAQSYLESIGTFASNVSDGIRNTFSTLEDSLVDFIKNGKFNFSNFAKAILDDLTRIIIRASIIRPLAQGILNFSGAGSTFTGDANIGGGISATAAKGASFDRGVKRFATGGIVSKPTLFGYGGGKTGLMGEAGTEAILPLSRGSGGDLGVKASVTPTIVNIYNNTGSEVETKEGSGPNGERTLDIIIQAKVKEGFATGAFDKTMRQAYGVTRKGS